MQYYHVDCNELSERVARAGIGVACLRLWYVLVVIVVIVWHVAHRNMGINMMSGYCSFSYFSVLGDDYTVDF